MSDQIWNDNLGSLKTWKQWLCEHGRGTLHQDVSVTIQPASFLYEHTAELQLVELQDCTFLQIQTQELLWAVKQMDRLPSQCWVDVSPASLITIL